MHVYVHIPIAIDSEDAAASAADSAPGEILEGE